MLACNRSLLFTRTCRNVGATVAARFAKRDFAKIYIPWDKKVECTGNAERSLNKGERNAGDLTPASATGSA